MVANGGTAPVISVCIVTGHRQALLNACLRSLQNQVSPPTFEVLVCADRDPDVVRAVRCRFPDAGVCLSEGRRPGAARNLLIEQARGDILLFLDDDVWVPPDMLRRLDVLSTEHPACAVFGGPNTTPPGSSRFQTVQGEVLASMLGSGPVRRRYQSFRSGPADDRSLTLCNLAIRRKAMVLFNERLRCAEENAVLAELGRRRAAMHYDAGLTAYHERRASVRTFGAQMYKYGYGRGQLTVREPRTLRATFLPPVLLLAYVLSSFPMTAAFGPAVVVPGILYGFAVMVASTRIGLKVRHAVAAPLAAALFVELHLAYGAGIVVGVAAEWAGRRSTPDPPAERNLTPTPEASWV